MSFDKKLMELEEVGGPEEEGDDGLTAFLRRQILPPLRTMLLVESRSKEEEEASKAKILLSVTTVKVLLRLPLDIFLREFQKVILKLSRQLKKRQAEAREYARNCLCLIAKAVGPYMLHSIINILKSQLKDNFDRHVFNFTVFKVLEGMELVSGDLDYCLPLVLPLVMEEVYGKSSLEKELVAKGELPTLKMEAKKKKGVELLQVLCKWLSHTQLTYVIDFLEKYLL